MTAKITPAQKAAIIAFLGQPELRTDGRCIKPESVRWGTVYALLARDLIKVESQASGVSSEIVHANWGRSWRTRRVYWCDTRYSVTDAGRAAVA